MPHPPQCDAFVATSTHCIAHRVGVAPPQPLTQADGAPAEQRGVGSVHVVVQPPQCAGIVRSTSHPSLAVLLQSANPETQAEAITQLPAAQVAVPPTWGRAVQSFPHAPQLRGSVWMSTQAPPQSMPVHTSAGVSAGASTGVSVFASIRVSIGESARTSSSASARPSTKASMGGSPLAS